MFWKISPFTETIEVRTVAPVRDGGEKRSSGGFVVRPMGRLSVDCHGGRRAGAAIIVEEGKKGRERGKKIRVRLKRGGEGFSKSSGESTWKGA